LKIQNNYPLRFQQTCQNYAINFTPITKEEKESPFTARLQSPVITAPPKSTPVKVKTRMNHEARLLYNAAAERKS
jgi:hypothetical protein